MPKVKCIYCKQQLERDSDECVKIRDRRYAHKTCAEGISAEERQKEEDKSKLYKYIKELFGDRANWKTIEKQLEKFQNEDGYTYSGILKSLMFHYGIKKHSPNEGLGNLAIVPYVYQQAYTYYYDMWLRQEQNKNAVVVPLQVVEVCIRQPATKHKVKLFDLGED